MANTDDFACNLQGPSATATATARTSTQDDVKYYTAHRRAVFKGAYEMQHNHWQMPMARCSAAVTCTVPLPGPPSCIPSLPQMYHIVSAGTPMRVYIYIVSSSFMKTGNYECKYGQVEPLCNKRTNGRPRHAQDTQRLATSCCCEGELTPISLLV